jgi:hypothetical protein
VSVWLWLKSLRRDERRRGGGGWKGCEEAEGDGEGGRDA